MKQFILESPRGADGFFRIEGRDFHYLVNVRRIKRGDVLNAALPSGEREALRVSVVDRGGRFCLLEGAGGVAEGLEYAAAGALPTIILLQAVLGGVKMNALVRQAAECGASQVIPFAAERSVRRVVPVERLRRIVREARQQSGSGVPTLVHAALEEREALSLWEEVKRTHEAPLGLFFHTAVELPNAGAGLEHCSIALHSCLKEKADAIVLALGPEGGFSEREAREFLARGFKPASLGPTVLRAETASLCALAAVRIILWERDSWN